MGVGLSATAQPLAFAGAFVKVIRLGFYPGNEPGNVRVRQKRFDMIVRACQLCLCEQGMNLPVADTMQVLGLSPTLGFGHEVMRILF